MIHLWPLRLVAVSRASRDIISRGAGLGWRLRPQPWRAMTTAGWRPGARAFLLDVEDLKSSDLLESDTSASSTGVIDVKDQSEVILFFDHIYPTAVLKLLLKGYFSRLTKRFQAILDDDATVKRRIVALSSSTQHPLPADARITELIPVKRDGGAFVKFSVPPTLTPKELIGLICANTRTNAKHATGWAARAAHLVWGTHPKCFQVKGTPWIEDLRRFPSPRLKVKFEGQPLLEEELYFLFRRYGLIVDIVPPPAGGAAALVIFQTVQLAVCAKNCITGIRLNRGATQLHIQYDPLKKINYVTDFIVNHQKILVPALLALLATVAVLIFDPIREWFIEQKITHKYSLTTYKDNPYVQVVYRPYRTVARWLSNGYDWVDDRVGSTCEDERGARGLAAGRAEDDAADPDSSAPNILWMERLEKVKQLKLWIYENISTFIIVKGPKGSGKQEFVLDHTLLQDAELKRKILYIDCDALVKTRLDNAMLQATAHQLGYFPLFTWTNSILQFIDLGVQSITGQKLGLSELKETQLKNMFLLTTQALRKVALADYSGYRRGVMKRQRRRQREAAAAEHASDSLIDDDLLKEDQYLQQHPECKPIIVINKFMLKADSNQDFIYKMLADWTLQVVQSNLAHVIYITHDVGSIQHLNDALPNQVFKLISLLDATLKLSKQYVLNQLSGNDIGGIDACLGPIGGRMLDLQAFIRRVKLGETPDDALQEMVSQAAEQITTFFLNKANDGDRNWLPAQVWSIMKILALHDSISYTELSRTPLFKLSSSTLATLSTLEKHDLVLLVREKGVLRTVLTGRPLYREAFKNLVADHNIYKIYESDYYADLILIESAKIAKLEDEISKVSNLSDMKLLKTRLEYIQDKIAVSTGKIVEYEAQVSQIDSAKPPSSGGIMAKIGLA